MSQTTSLPVSLAGPSGACKGVNDEGGELHGNFDDGAEQASLLLGQRLCVVNVICQVLLRRGWTKLPCVLLCWIPAFTVVKTRKVHWGRIHLFCGRENPWRTQELSTRRARPAAWWLLILALCKFSRKMGNYWRSWNKYTKRRFIRAHCKLGLEESLKGVHGQWPLAIDQNILIVKVRYFFIICWVCDEDSHDNHAVREEDVDGEVDDVETAAMTLRLGECVSFLGTQEVELGRPSFWRPN